MMTADQILAAHATRRPSVFADAIRSGRSNRPWFEDDDSLDGTMRAYLRGVYENMRKERSGHAEIGG